MPTMITLNLSCRGQTLVKISHPNDVHVAGCIQEILVFLIVAALALGGYRINQLLRRQAEVVRERANLARYFPPNIVEELAEHDQPLGPPRDKTPPLCLSISLASPSSPRARPRTKSSIRFDNFILTRSERYWITKEPRQISRRRGDGYFRDPRSSDQDLSNAPSCANALLSAVD